MKNILNKDTSIPKGVLVVKEKKNPGSNALRLARYSNASVHRKESKE